ncbi:MAG TPA: 50S ribosomal protein L10 [Oscillospiraceae bacterium]|nr:50S ribosomal protein L10 [Oscillospiraceae bacterium]HPF56951.1 50S ribosomal protein L10 [Clostridiales bacterium]HPK35170.1 50S ribosomal protein L10 [Oscillospiraceae bacterium]HPR74973.1 50S ribosomal protein L10 [Oscillospiraceae bacterium]
MPSNKILQEKQAAVAEIVNTLNGTISGVLVSYQGITVADDTKLRAELRKAGVKYKVLKNSLLNFAVKEAGLEGLTEVLEGTTALAVNTEGETAAAKILCEYAKKNEKFVIKAGFVEGNVIDADNVKALAKLPSKEVLIAQVLAGFNAPITGLVNVLNGNIRGLAVALNAIAEKKAAEAA